MLERLKSYLILAIAALALTVFACSSDDDASTESSRSTGSSTTAATADVADRYCLIACYVFYKPSI